jgi:hypothetical protein
MSLLYECINGIIQGGILEAVEGTSEGEEVARLCVSKLRGMMVIEGDANCKLNSETSQMTLFSSNHSKICCTTCLRQNCPISPSHRVAATGCDTGMY